GPGRSSPSGSRAPSTGRISSAPASAGSASASRAAASREPPARPWSPPTSPAETLVGRGIRRPGAPFPVGGLLGLHQRTELGELLAAQVVALAALDALEQVPHEGRELEWVERLRHVVDPADVEAARPVAELRAGREEDDRDPARARALEQ